MFYLLTYLCHSLLILGSKGLRLALGLWFRVRVRSWWRFASHTFELISKMVSVPVTLKGVIFLWRISIITPKRFHVEQRNLVWWYMGGGSSMFLGGQLRPRSKWPGHQRPPPNFGTSHTEGRNIRNKNQILHGDQTTHEGKFLHSRPWLLWGTGIRGLMRGMATLPQGNQELLVVRDKVGRPPGELGVRKSMECDIFPSMLW